MRQGYDWQVGQPTVVCWDRRLREEMDNIGLDYVQQNARDRNKVHVPS